MLLESFTLGVMLLGKSLCKNIESTAIISKKVTNTISLSYPLISSLLHHLKFLRRYGLMGTPRSSFISKAL